MLCKKAVYNSLTLQVYTPFDFQLRIKSVPFFKKILTYQKLDNKQTYFEIHHGL